MGDKNKEAEDAAQPHGQILVYTAEDGRLKIDVRLENESVWLTQAHLAELFQATVPNISMHLRNVFEEGELHRDSVVKEFLTTAADGKNTPPSFTTWMPLSRCILESRHTTPFTPQKMTFVGHERLSETDFFSATESRHTTPFTPTIPPLNWYSNSRPSAIS